VKIKLAAIALAICALGISNPVLAASHKPHRADAIGVICIYVNGNLCIATHGTGNRVTLDTQSNDTLFDLQPATGSGNYKLKVFNSTHCLTVSANDFVLSDDCQQGNGNQVWHRISTGSFRYTFNIQGTNPLYMGVNNPPFAGQDVQAINNPGNGFDYGWLSP
jgi:hypothetical protein